MKKLIALFLVATVLSCSSEDRESQEDASLVATVDSVLDGKVLSFKSEESFVKEYSKLAELNRDELQKWISSKGLVSLLNTSGDSIEMEEDVISESRVIYSDALKSVLNAESKVEIGEKVLWLNDRNFYLLSESEVNFTTKELLERKDKLQKYGQLLSFSGVSKSSTSRLVLPNENRIKTFISPEINVSGSRLRHVVDLYNETIALNDLIQSSKMFLRSTLQYRSCSSLGGCKWKEAFNTRDLRTYFRGVSDELDGTWTLTIFNGGSAVSGTQTYQVAYWRSKAPYLSNENFIISGPITCSIVGSNPLAMFSTEMSWYYN